MSDPIKKKWLVLTLGSWGRGDTVSEAATRCREGGGKLSDQTYVELIIGDDDPSVSGDGYILRSFDSTSIRFGYGIRLGQLTKVMEYPKEKGTK